MGRFSGVLCEDRRDWPGVIRSLLLDWSTAEGRDERILGCADALAQQILETTAPLDCAWALFPCYPDPETVSISYAADAMESLVHLAYAGGDGHYVGKAQHIAHILESQQRPDGSWPQRCDALRGWPLDDGLCAAAPMMLMNRLDQVMESCEYESVIERARGWLLANGQHSSGMSLLATPERADD